MGTLAQLFRNMSQACRPVTNRIQGAAWIWSWRAAIDVCAVWLAGRNKTELSWPSPLPSCLFSRFSCRNASQRCTQIFTQPPTHFRSFFQLIDVNWKRWFQPLQISAVLCCKVKIHWTIHNNRWAGKQIQFKSSLRSVIPVHNHVWNSSLTV